MPTNNKKPSYVYHYTTIDVLEKLFANLTETSIDPCEIEHELIFWATSVFYMNDKFESFETRIREGVLSNEDQFLFNFSRSINGEPCAISLSASKESIPMWQMYGGQGNGVCIEFDVSMLMNYMKQHERDNSLTTVQFKACRYVKKMPRIQRNEFGNSNDIIEKQRQMVTLMEQAIFTKNSAWSFEKEYRIGIFSHNIKFREKGSLLIPYCEQRLPLKAISSITLGPCCNKELSLQSVEMMLKQNHITSLHHFELRTSNSPFRQIK